MSGVLDTVIQESICPSMRSVRVFYKNERVSLVYVTVRPMEKILTVSRSEFCNLAEPDWMKCWSHAKSSNMLLSLAYAFYAQIYREVPAGWSLEIQDLYGWGPFRHLVHQAAIRNLGQQSKEGFLHSTLTDYNARALPYIGNADSARTPLCRD